MTRLREFLSALGVFIDLLAFALYLGALIGAVIFMARTVANLAP